MNDWQAAAVARIREVLREVLAAEEDEHVRAILAACADLLAKIKAPPGEGGAEPSDEKPATE